MLVNTKNTDENKENVKDLEYRISDLKDRIKKISEKEKKIKMQMRHYRLLKKFLIIIKKLKKFFIVQQKLIKKKSKPKIEESIAERIKLRRQKLDIITKKKEKINNTMFNYYFDYSNPEIMFKKLRDESDEKNKKMVKSINKKLK